MKCLVLDFGGTFVKYSVMDENQVRYEKGEIPSPVQSAEDLKRVTGEIYERFVGEVEGASISFPGFIDTDTTYLAGGGAFMPLYHTYLKDVFDECIKVPYVIENDGKCGALAEAWGGALAGAKSGIVVILGTGVAGGLLQDGKVYKGKHFTAGELSFLTLDWGLGMQNLAQVHCSASSLIAKVQMAKGQPLTGFGAIYEQMGAASVWKRGETDPSLNGVEIDGIKVFELLNAGDPDVVEIYDQFCEDMAAMLFNLQCIYDPDKIAIGGGISRQDRLVPDIEAKLHQGQNPLMQMLPLPELVRCQYPGDANQYGAMYNYLMKYHPEML